MLRDVPTELRGTNGFACGTIMFPFTSRGRKAPSRKVVLVRPVAERDRAVAILRVSRFREGQPGSLHVLSVVTEFTPSYVWC
jgi:hypothetical protein